MGLKLWCDVSASYLSTLEFLALLHLQLLLNRFKTTDVAAVMDHENVSGSSGSDLDTEDDRNSRESTSANREKSTTTTRPSMRGLQIAIAEGWLVQRARDMCSFAHDRYRQAAEAEALSLPSDLIAKMSFRVRLSDKLFFSYLPT